MNPRCGMSTSLHLGRRTNAFDFAQRQSASLQAPVFLLHYNRHDLQLETEPRKPCVTFQRIDTRANEICGNGLSREPVGRICATAGTFVPFVLGLRRRASGIVAIVEDVIHVWEHENHEEARAD